MEEINLNMTDSVYINIHGIGNKDKNSSEFDITYNQNQILEVIGYNSEDKMSDFLKLRKDAIKLKEGKELTENSRLISMCNLIIFYLLHTNLNVIIIGHSHGALIIHGAILKLQMILNDDLKKALNSNRIYIITNGSPRYLPKKLLEKEQIYNVYNVEDRILNNFITRRIPFFQLPKFTTTKVFISKCDVDINKKIYYSEEDDYIYVKFFNFYPNEQNNHIYGLNLYIIFGCKIPDVLNHILTTDHKHSNIEDFDRILYKIGDFFIKDSTSKDNIIYYLDEYNIRDINSFLNLLSDKDIFQLYFSFLPDIPKTSMTRKSNKVAPAPDGIIKENIKVDKKIKDNLNLLSINQLSLLCGNSGHINYIKTAREFIRIYNQFIKNIKSLREINYNDLLEYLRNYNRQICIEFLKTCSIQEIKENIKLLHYDIKISIYISLTLKNLSSMSIKKTISDNSSPQLEPIPEVFSI